MIRAPLTGAHSTFVVIASLAMATADPYRLETNMKTTKFSTLAMLAGIALAGATLSTQAYADMSSMPMGKDASTQAFQHADESMMDAMESPAYTGNADRDFVTHMIPHHQGAVDMAEVELKYGKDPAIRKLAAGVIQAQKQEIALMKQWLATHGGM
jgi:uncharacterized protein (DUF305 family)